MNAAPHFAVSSDGVRIAYWEAGRADGDAIVFLHGFLFDHHVFHAQFADSGLADNFRLIALDLRGHGQSGRPANAHGYTDGAVWADDLHAVLEACRVQRAIVVAWSFSGRMLNDYLRHHGHLRIAGINYVAAATLADPSAIGTDHRWLAEACSPEPAVAAAAEAVLIEKVLGQRPGAQAHTRWMNSMHGTTQQDRLAMRSRVLDYDGLLAALPVPVLLSHGTHDSFVLPTLATRLSQKLQRPVLSLYEGAGHAPFAESSSRFNHELLSFARLHL